MSTDSRRNWVRLDNASNIFLAARNAVDPKVFRMTAEMDHPVEEEYLQQAALATLEKYPLYRAVLRRGVFWYYMQDSSLLPVVEEEHLHTCSPIYHHDKRTLLFRVLYQDRRIHIEVFHALSDGTGALWFLTDLVAAYLALRAGQPIDTFLDETDRLPRQELSLDSFAENFRPRPRPRGGRGKADSARSTKKARTVSHSKVFQWKGTRTPDHRTRLVEVSMNSRAAISLAKADGVSLTMYLTALFFVSLARARVQRSLADMTVSETELSERIAQTMAGETMGVSVPINLRQYFPSTSARNFFATVQLEHTFGAGDDTVAGIARNLQEQFAESATEDALAERLETFLKFEKMPLLRIVPRPVKDVVLRGINWVNNRGLTVAISNLGRVVLPGPVESAVQRMFFHVSAVRPQFCSISHGDTLTISFSSPFVEVDYIREFVRHFTSHGVDATVAAPAVTAEEIEQHWEVEE